MSNFPKEEELKFLKEKYKIALQIKEYKKAKEFLLKIKDIENSEN